VDDLKIIIELIKELVILFGPTLTIISVIAFVYFRYLKKGGILVVAHNNNGNEEKGNKQKPTVLNTLCNARLKACDEKFDIIKERLNKNDKNFEEQNKVINETHTNVAILLERTEHLKRS